MANGDGNGGTLAKYVEGGYKLVLVILIGLLGFLGKEIYDKVDSAIDKQTFQLAASEIRAAADKSNTALWDSISKTTTAQQQLVTSLSVLQAQFSAHAEQDKGVIDEEKDHEQRLRLLEATRPK